MKPKEYAETPTTFGEHIRKRRLELGMTQAQAGTLMGVCAATVLNWETGETEPVIPQYLGVIRFLGYDPSPVPVTLPDRLRAFRRTKGWSTRQAARSLGVDPTTWERWERGELVQKRRDRARIAALLQMNPEAFDDEMYRRWNRAHRKNP